MRNVWRITAFMAGMVFLMAGCSGLTVVAENGVPHYESRQKESGPPPWAPAHGYRAKHRYHYYPGCQTYYDVDGGVYFYLGRDGWSVSASLPRSIQLVRNEYVLLEMDTDKPYEYHGDIIRKYPPGQAKKQGNGKGKK